MAKLGSVTGPGLVQTASLAAAEDYDLLGVDAKSAARQAGLDTKRQAQALVRLVAATFPLLGIWDVAVIPLSASILSLIFPSFSSQLTPGQLLALAVLSGALALAFSELTASPPGPQRATVLTGALRASLSTLAVTSTVIVVSAALLPAASRADHWQWMMYWYLAVTLANGILHYAVGAAVECVGSVASRAIIICAADRAEALARAVARTHGWQWLGSYDINSDRDVATAQAMARHHLLDVVVLDMLSMDRGRIWKTCDLLAESPVRICLGYGAASLGGSSDRSLVLNDLVVSPLGPTEAALKRATDLILGSIALVLLLPLLLASVAAIRCETKGGVLFRQWRFGQGGQPFQALKLRTMYVDDCCKNGEIQTSPNDPRITRVGKFLRRTSIDELPQLFNVLKGEMSLVGPRAHPIHMKVEGLDYADAVRVYRLRHRMKPGITGWAQVNGSRGAVTTVAGARRRLELDLYYISHWSVFLDLIIMLRTICGGFIAADE